MSREPWLYLEEILAAIDAVGAYVAGMDRNTFRGDHKTQDAVLLNPVVMGEAVKALPEEIATRHPEIDWRKIAGMRDMLVHQYFSTDLDIVWDAAARRLPEVRAVVSSLVESERPGQEKTKPGG